MLAGHPPGEMIFAELRQTGNPREAPGRQATRRSLRLKAFASKRFGFALSPQIHALRSVNMSSCAAALVRAPDD